jgi:hypothetical protein
MGAEMIFSTVRGYRQHRTPRSLKEGGVLPMSKQVKREREGREGREAGK